MSISTNTSMANIYIPVKLHTDKTGPEVINLFPCSNELSMNFILLINVKMPTIVGILTFISRINTLKTPPPPQKKRKKNQHFSFYELLKFHAQMS